MASRFLHIQIYNDRQTQVVYDNRVDTDWGIDVGSVSVSDMIMSEELRYGEVHSRMFQAKIFGIDENIDKRLIKVFMIITEGSSESSIQIFKGYIDSSKKDAYGTYRDLVAYDWFHFYRELNVAEWWNDFWDGFRPDDTILATQDGKIIKTQRDIYGHDAELIQIRKSHKKLKEIKDSFFDYLTDLDIGSDIFPISYSENGLNIDFTWLNLFEISTLTPRLTVLKLEDMLTALGQLYACTFHIWGDGVIRPIRLWDSAQGSRLDYSNNLEGANSEWEDYKTDTITGVAVYDESDKFRYLWGGDKNAYKIVGNILLLNADNQALSDLQLIQDILRYHTYRYTPCNINLIESNIMSDLGLGYAIQLDEDGEVISYIMSTTLSGSQLINQNIQCFALGQTLTNDLDTYNDSFVTSTKIGRIEQDAEKFRVEYEDFADKTETTMEIMAGKYVLQVRNDGTVARVQMGIDDQGDSNFEISADNLNFIANNIMQLTTNHLGINSENFKVGTDGTVEVNGKIIAQSGKIGGFNASTSKPATNNTSANGGHYYANSLWVHVTSGDSQYEYEIGMQGGGTTPGTIAFYVYRIPYGAEWIEANVTPMFKVLKNGNLFCNNAILEGDIVVDERVKVNRTPYSSSGQPATLTMFKATQEGVSHGGGLLVEDVFRFYEPNGSTWLYIDTSEETSNHNTKKLTGPIEISGSTKIRGYEMFYGSISSFWNMIPAVQNDGVMEIGKHLDFHYTSSHSSDYSFRLTNNADGQLTASGTITQGSSRKIKENIEDIELEEAEKILELNPVKFDYINGAKDRRGFIAEEVNEVLPNLVTPEEEDIPASLDYNGIIPYLVKMVQKQQQEIDELKRRLGDG